MGGGTRTTFGVNGPSEERSIEASDDGTTFRRVAYIPLGVIQQQTIAIPALPQNTFRVTFKNPVCRQGFGCLAGVGEAPKAPTGTDIAEVALHPITHINHFEEKAGFAAATDLPQHPTPATADAIAESDVVDLTGKLTAMAR